jgi:regulation of enolase protein 1 (concanavalin A-like superfamily)
MLYQRVLFLILVLALVVSGCASEQPLPTLTPTLTPAPTTAMIEYQPDNSLFPNPERGWIQSVMPANRQSVPLSLNQLLTLRNSPDQVTLVRKYYYLGEFRKGALPPDFLLQVEQDLRTCRAAGVKLIPRFVYVWVLSWNRLDAPLEIASAHLEQLKPIFDEYWDVIAHVEAGLVGSYGEWHDSSSGYINNWTLMLRPAGIKLRDKYLEVLPEQRMIAMRYLYWHKMKFFRSPLTAETAFSGTTQARIGYHHDMVMSTKQWQTEGCSECPAYDPMTNYLMADNLWVVQSGEPSGIDDDNYSTTQDPRPELRSLHYSSLVRNANDSESAPHYMFWREQGYYDDLTRDLGYRFRLVKATLPLEVAPGGAFSATLEMTNDGFAGIYNPRGVEIILRNTATRAQYALSMDKGWGNRKWLPGPGSTSTLEFSGGLPDTLPTGEYEVFLNLPDPAEKLHNRPEYSIRLANQDVWEAFTGYNRLLHKIQVTNTSVSPAYSGTEFFTKIQDFADDQQAPFPNPAVWATAPYTFKTDSVTMQAAPESDVSGVEYFFQCLSAGCHDSGWQADTVYIDSGLSPNTAYTYRVKSRDMSVNHNETAWSGEGSATTNLVDDVPMPSPWGNQDVGLVKIAGNARINPASGYIFVDASGEDIYNEADGFHYVYQPLDGDGEIVARVLSLKNVNDWAKAGVMIRETLDADSKHAMMIVSAMNGTSFQWRAFTNSATNSKSGADSLAAPVWVKISRKGDELTGFVSTDGLEWRQIYSMTIPMTPQVYIGLAVTAHTNSQTTSAIFDQVTVTPAAK